MFFCREDAFSVCVLLLKINISLKEYKDGRVIEDLEVCMPASLHPPQQV